MSCEASPKAATGAAGKRRLTADRLDKPPWDKLRRGAARCELAPGLTDVDAIAMSTRAVGFDEQTANAELSRKFAETR